MQASTIVGYSNNEFGDGFRMMGMNFQAVGEEGIHISDLVPQGYKGNSKYEKGSVGGIKGVISVQILDIEGGTEVDEDDNELIWKWVHTWETGTGWLNDAHWVDSQGRTVVKGDDDTDYLFDNGQGLWVSVSTGWKAGMNLNTAGEALLDATDLDLADGFCGMAIPLSAACKIANADGYNIFPHGYIGNSKYEKGSVGGIKGVISMQILDIEGGTEVDEDDNELIWKWIHTWETGTGWLNDAHWVDSQGRTVSKDVGNFEFPMGQALWVSVSTGWKSGMKMSFEGIDNID